MFVGEVDEIPDGAITVFSAHGISEKVENAARLRELPVIDATCPLVTKVHREAQRYEAEGREIMLIGHEGHPEVEGTSGRVKQGVHAGAERRRRRRTHSYQSRKTGLCDANHLSVDDTKDIIAALKNTLSRHRRAGAARYLLCDAKPPERRARTWRSRSIWCWSSVRPTASNSNRLRDLAAEIGVPAYLIDDARRPAAAMVRYHRIGGHHRRRIGAGTSGARRDRRHRQAAPNHHGNHRRAGRKYKI